MGDYTPNKQSPSSSSAPSQPSSRFDRGPSQQNHRERMSQQKYNPQQMLFVKNIPQESAMRLAGLYTQFKPLETKNLYPESRITTFMIALPNIGATEEALRRTNGLKIGNTIITVERYNPKQSIIARRDARKKRSNFANGRADYSHDEEDYDEYDGDEGVRAKKDTPKAAKLTAKQPEVPVTPPRTRRVSASGGISWANVAGGTQPEQHALSPPAPPAAKDNQRRIDRTDSCPEPDLDAQPESAIGLNPPPAADGRPNTRLPPPGLSAPAVAFPLLEDPPSIASTPTTASLGPRTLLPQLPSSSTPSYHHFHTTSEGPTPPQATQTQSSESSRMNEDFSQQTQVPNAAQLQRGSLAMPTDTTTFIRNRHCGNCAFCKMQTRNKFRANNGDVFQDN